MRSFLPLIICGTFLISALAGCAIGDPSPMPRGYSSYGQDIKSVDGPKARNIGYNYSRDKNEVTLNNIRPIVKEMAELLDKKLTFGVDEIYLKTPVNTAFYNSFDYLLRDELMQLGYRFVNTPIDNTVKIDFVAKTIPYECTVNNIYLALAINTIDDNPSDIVGGFYKMPLYGYRPAGNINIDVPPCLSK